MGKEKTLNPILRIDSNELVEKAGICLEKTGMFSIIWLYDSDVSWGTFKDLFELNAEFVRGLCQACNGYFYSFKSPDKNIKQDGKGLCINCGILLTIMTMLEIDHQLIGKWLTSKGEVNPLIILKEAVEKNYQGMNNAG